MKTARLSQEKSKMSLPPNNQELIPMSREILNQIYNNNVIYYSRTRLQTIVKDIYRQTLYYANIYMNKYYYYKLPTIYKYNNIQYFYDMYGPIDCRNVISELETLFPNCSIKIKVLYEDKNGFIYNYENNNPNVVHLHPIMCIVIEWF